MFDTGFDPKSFSAAPERRAFSPYRLVGKRMGDLVAVAILSVPVLLVVMACVLAIKVTVGGPAFFRQKRYGRDRKPFHILKLRTMNVAEDGADVQQARARDDRVTAVGRILRRLSLDELPQLWNVAKGEMSIIGPRPHAIAHDDVYGAQIANYNERFKAKPGITGLAQVRGQRGPTETVGKMAARVNSDIEYASRLSFAMDTSILFRTFLIVLRGTNAH